MRHGPYLLCALLTTAGCGSEADRGNPFAPLPECQGASVAYGKGDRTLVIAALDLAASTEGFDLDGDGKIDNKLGVISSLASDSLQQTFQKRHDVIIPLEFYGATGADTECSKFALYLGQFNKDRDQDKVDTNWDRDKDHAKGDCNDQDPAVGPNQPEIIGNSVDDDCDGFADNKKRGEKDPGNPIMDQDGDGFTMADGDCDDRAGSPLAKLRHPGAAELCDGIDYNCDGVPDNGPKCDPFGDANVRLDIQKVSLDGSGQPVLVFRSGQIKDGQLAAGPSLFKVSLNLLKDATLELELSGARVRGKVRPVGDLLYLDDAMLGGVLEAVSLARLDKINAKGFLMPPQSLFDAIWAGGVLNTILNLKQDKDGHILPDMDVDGDGLETFWAADPNKTPAMVDTCRDGDGTIIRNGDTQFPNDDPMKRCVFARDGKGAYRFVDGISAALKFRAVPARLGDLVDSLKL